MNRSSRIFLLFLILLGLASSCRSAPHFNFGPYSEAEKLYQKGKYEKAIAKYEEYLRENPQGNIAVVSYYYMAKSYEGLDRPEKARPLYRKIAKEHPGLIWAEFAKTRLKELK